MKPNFNILNNETSAATKTFLKNSYFCAVECNSQTFKFISTLFTIDELSSFLRTNAHLEHRIH